MLLFVKLVSACAQHVASLTADFKVCKDAALPNSWAIPNMSTMLPASHSYSLPYLLSCCLPAAVVLDPELLQDLISSNSQSFYQALDITCRFGSKDEVLCAGKMLGYYSTLTLNGVPRILLAQEDFRPLASAYCSYSRACMKLIPEAVAAAEAGFLGGSKQEEEEICSCLEVMSRRWILAALDLRVQRDEQHIVAAASLMVLLGVCIMRAAGALIEEQLGVQTGCWGGGRMVKGGYLGSGWAARVRLQVLNAVGAAAAFLLLLLQQMAALAALLKSKAWVFGGTSFGRGISDLFFRSRVWSEAQQLASCSSFVDARPWLLCQLYWVIGIACLSLLPAGINVTAVAFSCTIISLVSLVTWCAALFFMHEALWSFRVSTCATWLQDVTTRPILGWLLMSYREALADFDTVMSLSSSLRCYIGDPTLRPT